jgi:hypothetical protein
MSGARHGCIKNSFIVQSPLIIQGMTKMRRMNDSAHKILVINYKGKGLLARQRRRRMDSIKIVLK